MVSNADQLDTDSDGDGNACDTDDDNDSVADSSDNCPLVSNSSQLDTDSDGSGNACDSDDDGDGVADDSDDYPLNPNVHTAPTAASASSSLNLLPQTTNTVTGTASSTSQDSRSVTYSVVSSPSYGTVEFTNSATGAWSYSTTQTQARSDSFTFKVNDGYVDSSAGTISLSLKTDPLYQYQWHLDNTGQTNFATNSGTSGEDINVDSVIVSGLTGDGVRIAVVDTGLEIAHEDLLDNVVVGGSYNFVDGTTDPTTTATDGDHGTSVAGIIAAAGWNNKGGRVLPLRLILWALTSGICQQ